VDAAKEAQGNDDIFFLRKVDLSKSMVDTVMWADELRSKTDVMLGFAVEKYKVSTPANTDVKPEGEDESKKSDSPKDVDHDKPND
jgi:hypothetical protein